jgi:hypothetical protein
VLPVRYELDFYIPEDGFVQSHRRENLNSYIAVTMLRRNLENNVVNETFEESSCMKRNFHRRGNKTYEALVNSRNTRLSLKSVDKSNNAGI